MTRMSARSATSWSRRSNIVFGVKCSDSRLMESAHLLLRISGLVVVILSSACVRSGRPPIAIPTNGIAQDETARVVDIPSLGIRVTLGNVEQVVRKGEFDIIGGNPDGPMSANVVGPLTKIFFTC